MRASPLWQKLIWAALFLVVYEGALRKWVLPGLQAELYFGKDLVLIAAYILFLVSRTGPGYHLKITNTLKTLLLLSLAYFMLELANPNSPSILVSIAGLKNYLLYTPLAFIAPYMFTSSDDLERKLRRYAFWMFPCVALGLVQFALPPTHWLNSYLDNLDSDIPVMGAVFSGEIAKVRAIGTFSYIGGYTEFLTVMCYLVVGLIAKSRWRISGNLWLSGYLVITVAAMFTTGSRGPIWGVIATLPVALCIWGYGGLISGGNAVKIMFGAAIIWVSAQVLAPGAFEAYSTRAEHAQDTVERLLSPISQTVQAMGLSGPIGTGMGSTSGGALALMHTHEFWWLSGNLVEVEPGRVLEETGILGFLLVYGARIWLFVKAISLSARFRNPMYMGLGGVIACLFLQDLVLGFVVNNATVGIYHWFAAGLLFAMYRLERVEETLPQAGALHDQGALGRYRRISA